MYFWNKTLHVSDSSSIHHQEFFTVHTAMVCVIQVCWQLASRIRTELVWFCCSSCQQTCMTYTIAVCTAKNSRWWTEELSETCRVLFQNEIWEIGASSWFYYKNLTRYTVTWTSNTHTPDNNLNTALSGMNCSANLLFGEDFPNVPFGTLWPILFAFAYRKYITWASSRKEMMQNVYCWLTTKH